MQFFLLIAKFSVRPYGTKPTQNVRGTVRMEFSVRQYGTKPTQNVRGTVRIKFSGCQHGTKPTQNVRGTVRKQILSARRRVSKNLHSFRARQIESMYPLLTRPCYLQKNADVDWRRMTVGVPSSNKR